MAVRGLWEWRWGSIGLNLTATAAGGRTALLYTAMADILPQETIANLDGKQQGRYFRKKIAVRFSVQQCRYSLLFISLSLSLAFFF